ncbi:MAG: hypothetical protein AB8G11_08235 [Saprospiraceae bacterium]
MKQVLFLIFSMVGVLGFGQDCGCMETLYSQMVDVMPLENPNEYEADTLYLEATRFHGSWLLYLVNRTDSTFVDEPFSGFYKNPKVTIQSKDSLGNWKSIRMSHISDLVSGGGIELPKNHYAITSVHDRIKGNYPTESRIELSFKNNIFYSESVPDTIDYCEFESPFTYLESDRYGKAGWKFKKEYLEEYVSKMEATSDECIKKAFRKNGYYYSKTANHAMIIGHYGYYETSIRLLNLAIEEAVRRNEETFEYRQDKALITYFSLMRDTTCFNKEDSLIRKSFLYSFLINEYEALLPLDKTYYQTMRASIEMKDGIKKVMPRLMSKEEFQNLNYQDYITTIDGEEYFKN